MRAELTLTFEGAQASADDATLDHARGRLRTIRCGARAYHDLEAARPGVVDDVARAYRNAGYPEARAGAYRARRSEDGSIDVEVRVAAGPRVRLGRVTVERVDGGDAPRTALTTGGWYREDDVLAAERALEDGYRDDGYARAVVAHTVQLDGERADVRFEIDRGRRFVLREVQLSRPPGRVTTLDAEDIGLTLGAPVRRREVEAARARLAQELAPLTVRWTLDVRASGSDGDAPAIVRFIAE